MTINGISSILKGTINMRLVVIFVVLLNLSMTIYAHASPVSAETYGKLPSKSMLVISPSGEKLAYRDTTVNRDMAIVINLADRSLVAAVDISAVKPNNMYFIDEEQLIFVASEYKKIQGFKGKHNVSVAMAYNLKTKKLHQLLIPGNGIHKGQTAVGAILGE
jgi:hypothetical protein